MSIFVADFIHEETTTTGTAEFLTLTSVSGSGRFSDAFAVGDIVYYSIVSGSNREAGVGSMSATNTLQRATPTTTLVSGVFDDSSPSRISLTSTSNVYVSPTKELITSKSVFKESGVSGVPPFGGNFSIDFLLQGPVYHVTLDNGGTLTDVTNFRERSSIDGDAAVMKLILRTVGTQTMGWPAWINWNGGSAPTMPVSGTILIELISFYDYGASTNLVAGRELMRY